jgi:hypothetical protein
MENIHPDLKSVIELMTFLEKKATHNPTKTNIRRKEIFAEVFNGKRGKYIKEKYSFKYKDGANYVNKLLCRYSSYAGLSKPVNIRTIRKYGELLSTY